jgi:mono/diheme cytochrome c family protein
MIFRHRFRTFGAFALATLAGSAWTAHYLSAQPAAAPAPLEPGFQQTVKPFLQKNCQQCHNADNLSAGVRVDHLDTSLEDRHIRVWEGIRHRVRDGSMPPKGMPQPSAAEREATVAWITQAIEIARLRPAPKNGLVRRLTVSQYRNTLRELLQLEDDLTEIVPPDAVSSDGFVNNKDTLQLSPLLLESYLEIAEKALNRSIVDPTQKPAIQNFRMDLGASINNNPLPEELILGANSLLLDNKDFTVTELTPRKPFPFQPNPMRTQYRFIEGYQGNDTVRGWREYDSIYHSVFACMRGSNGYPKGKAYDAVAAGLLLRPAIPNDETFEADGTYGPKANFKISLRELPDHGRFRVTVTAAKYDDGLLLDPGATVRTSPDALTVTNFAAPQTLTVKQAGVYQVDIHTPTRKVEVPAPDTSRLNEGLSASWTFEGQPGGGLEGKASLQDSPFGKALTLQGDYDALTVPHQEEFHVGAGEFTVAAWIQPKAPRRAAIVSLGSVGRTPGWTLFLGGGRNALQFETTGPDKLTNGTITSGPGVVRSGAWQHVAVVVKRGSNAPSRIYINGVQVAQGVIGAANLDNAGLPLRIGGSPNATSFRGDIDDVRLYRRALSEAELQGLIEPGRKFAQAPPEPAQDITLALGGREFSGALKQPAFLAVRLPAGPVALRAATTGALGIERVVLTPVPATDPLARRFQTFEKRNPRLGVQLGLRRDCGSTFAPVGSPQVVSSGQNSRFIFEGAIQNFPSPEVEKDNVNYLAGIREIAVRSEYTDDRDMPRLRIRSVEFEGPFYESWPPPSHKAIFIDSPRKADPKAYAREIIRNFATRAYRRPLAEAEANALFAVFDRSFAGGGKFQDSVKDALQVVLTSPQFLFLVEKSATPAPEPLDNHELASKLSYFLWNGPPDQTTLRLAAAGTLRQQLDGEVARMVADARFSRFIQEFASQWLSLDKFSVLEPDRKRFPKLNRHNRTHLRQEPIEFVHYLIRNNLPVRNLIASDFVVVNEAVATYYDLGEKTESGLRYVAVPHGRREMGGVLTQAAIMAGLSDGRESNPVKRGAWLARKIVAEPPADPPPNVPALKDDEGGKLTLRQRIERHRSQPGCVQCHLKIDPWGIAFEEFDAGGRLKSEPADARSQLPDKTEVAGIDDLKRYLAEDRIDQVAFSVLKHMATYATGRSLTYNEVNYLKQDGLKLKASGYRMQDMLRYVATSKIFLEK